MSCWYCGEGDNEVKGAIADVDAENLRGAGCIGPCEVNAR